MKKYLFFTAFLISLSSFGQKSYYFSASFPTGAEQVTGVDNRFHGTYRSDQVNRTYVVDKEGIFLISTNISSISRETIRESSKYRVENGFLHGVVANDSVPCVLEGEHYYFGVKNKEVLFRSGGEHQLTKSKNEVGTFYLNLWENGNFIPLRLRFEKNKLFVAYFDYEQDTELFDPIATKKVIRTEFHELIVLSPTDTECEALSVLSIFPSEREFGKIK